jgi:hypothetical protein
MKDQLKKHYEKPVKFNMSGMEDLGNVEPIFNQLFEEYRSQFLHRPL